MKWVVIGRMKPGTYKVPSWFSLRKWFVDKLIEVETSAIVPIYDTLYARPWCIALGMKCGARCEIALPARLPYDLVELGEESFICSDTSVGMPLRRNGEMVLERTSTERRGFLGNDSVITQGTVWPADSLLGALSVSPHQSELGTRTGQVWLGSPPRELPGRQHFDQFDSERTYRPTGWLYFQRLVHETFRIILPSVASLLVAAGMLNVFDLIEEKRSLTFAIFSVPVLDLVAAVVGLAALLLLKKALIGTYRPNVQPLWSPFVWKTETFATFLHDFAAPLFLAPMLGTPYYCVALRIMGAKVGRRAFIDTSDLTEFDLLSIGEDAALNFNAPLQAHLFEDRVMKLGRIKIGDRCSLGNYSVVLFDSELKADSHVGHISLVMKEETIPSGTFWEGSPARARTIDPLITGSSNAPMKEVKIDVTVSLPELTAETAIQATV
jgi:non-ribosomal peptide synthetase-like protein